MPDASEGPREVAALKERAIGRFCQRPGNFPVGRPFNCCESVLLTLAEYLGLESELVPRIGTAIGAGVSLNGLLCGCVSGAAMAIGLKHGRNRPEESPEAAWRLMDRFVASFKERFGALNCRQLTGLDLKTAEGLKVYFGRVHDQECTQRIGFAVEEAVGLLGEQG